MHPHDRSTRLVVALRRLIPASAALVVLACLTGCPSGNGSGGAAAQPRQVQTPPETVVGLLNAKLDGLVGTKWADLEVARYMPTWPKDIDKGRRAVVFYAMDCDHCGEVLKKHFSGSLPCPTTAIAVPEPDGFPKMTKRIANPSAECERLELPVGPTWFFTPPIVMIFDNGVLSCVADEDAELEACLGS